MVIRNTAASRISRAWRRINEWCRTHRHEPVWWQHQKLSQKLRGHFAYYGITGNVCALSRVRYATRRCWQKWLSRRSQTAYLSWARFNQILERYPLPPARVVHSIYKHAANPPN